MGIALFTTAKLFAPLQNFLSDCVVAATRWGQRVAPSNTSAGSTLSFPACNTKTPAQRPLRVIRVLDGVHGNRAVGRMVISGRMADVCAELDRLVAMEGMGS